MAGSLAMLMASLAALTERKFFFLDADGANRVVVEIALTTGDGHLVRHAGDVPQAVHPRRRQPRDRRRRAKQQAGRLTRGDIAGVRAHRLRHLRCQQGAGKPGRGALGVDDGRDSQPLEDITSPISSNLRRHRTGKGS